MTLLLIGFILGTIVGALSWILAAAWLESQYASRHRGSSAPGLTRLFQPGKSSETRA